MKVYRFDKRVMASDRIGATWISRKRIFTDGKPRRYGFSRVGEQVKP